MSFLDKTGLQHLWGKIRGIIGTGSLNTTNKTIIPAINELNNGLKIVKYEGTHSISSNGNIVIDISSSIPSGKSLIAVLVVQLGVYPLPYMAQAGTSKFLYIEQVNIPQKTVKLKNTGTGDWNNYNVIITSVVG